MSHIEIAILMLIKSDKFTKITIDNIFPIEDCNKLRDKGLVWRDHWNSYSLTDKGNKVVNHLILGYEFMMLDDDVKWPVKL